MNSGAEAVESALKAVRKWGYEVKGVPADRAEIIVCANNFHGRTLAIVGFSTDPDARGGFGPFAPGFRVVPFGDFDALAAAINENTVAFLVEPIQGEAGVIIPPPGYFKKVRALCSERKVTLILDEIQTGLGRTGKLLAEEHEGIEADVTLVGKALSGGYYPVSAVLSNSEVLGVLKPGQHGSTFGGNPLACAIARAALKVLVEEGMIQNAARQGARFLVAAAIDQEPRGARSPRPRPDARRRAESRGRRRTPLLRAAARCGPARQGHARAHHPARAAAHHHAGRSGLGLRSLRAGAGGLTIALRSGAAGHASAHAHTRPDARDSRDPCRDRAAGPRRSRQCRSRARLRQPARGCSKHYARMHASTASRPDSPPAAS